MDPVVFAQTPGAQLEQVDAGLDTQQALRELHLRHLQTKEGDTDTVFNGGATAEGQGQGRLAHTRTGGDDDKIAVLKPRGDVVQIGVARVDPGDRTVLAVGPLDALEGLLQNNLDRLEALSQFLFGEREDASFRPVEQLVNVGLAFVGAAGNLRRRLDQAPAQTPLDDDLGVAKVKTEKTRFNNRQKLLNARDLSAY